MVEYFVMKHKYTLLFWLGTSTLIEKRERESSKMAVIDNGVVNGVAKKKYYFCKNIKISSWFFFVH
jgi:hypothetical protein